MCDDSVFCALMLITSHVYNVCKCIEKMSYVFNINDKNICMIIMSTLV